MNLLKLFLIVLLASFVFSCAGIATTNEPLINESIIDVPGMSADEIHEKSKDWIALSFRSAKSVIGYDDIESHLLTGNGSVTAPIYMSGKNSMGFKFTLRSKEGKFKMTYSDYYWIGLAHPNYLSAQYTKDSYDNSFSAFNEDLKEYILNGDVGSW